MPKAFDAIVVGAGFAGLYALYRLRERGYAVCVLEAAADIGGTWYNNRYPGARCDIESLQYSYSFSEEVEQEWDWTERYAAQPEILRYIHHVADRFGLRSDIRLNARAVAAVFDEARHRWRIETGDGEVYSAAFCIMATGCLSVPIDRAIPGLDGFAGDLYRTTDWPHDGVDFSGRRVGIVGTGSSAIQAIPIVAEAAGELTVFQRTANYVIPAHNRPLDAVERAEWKRHCTARRAAARRTRNNALMAHNTEPGASMPAERREAVLEARWQLGGLTFTYGFPDQSTDRRVNEAAADFVRRKIAGRVRDPETARKLMPRDHPLGSKRLCVDTEYFEAFNRPNVHLVDLREEALVAVEPAGVRTAKMLYPLDALILATGFDAMTGALGRIDPKSRGGRSLREKWKARPSTLLGLAVAGFPNLFIVTGPGSPSVLSNMVTSAEQNVDWIAACLDYLRANGLAEIEAREEAEDAWFAQVAAASARTLLPEGDSWYVGANVPGKPRVYMPYLGGVPAYLDACEAAAADGYNAFALTPADPAVAAE